MCDRHREGYFKQYHEKIKAEAIEAYGAKCSCSNCINNRILNKREIKILRLFLNDGKLSMQGQFGIASKLRKLQYPQNAAKLLCRDCYMGRHLCDNRQYKDKHIQLIRQFKKIKIVRKLK